MSERSGARPWFLVRVYSYGVLMIALAVGASVLVARYSLRSALDGPSRPASTWIAWHMAELADRPEELNAQLLDLKNRVQIDMAVYELNGRLLGTTKQPALPPAEADELARLQQDGTLFGRGWGLVLEPKTERSPARYVVLRYKAPDWPLSLILRQAAVALLVLALVSIPLARSVTAPLASLSSMARRFGKGDLTARFRSRRRDEIGALGRAFDDMADRITALRRSEKELLANVSHELRTPLARIRLALELVTDGDRDKASSYLTDIGEDLAELERLLEDVLSTARMDLARDSAGDAQPPLHFESLSARTLIEAAANRFLVRYPERALTCRIPAQLPMLEADPVLRRVFDNLLDNARKFSESPVELSARVTEDGAQLVVEVADRGIGVSAADQQRIFEPFYRSDPSRTRATGGVGLGLVVVRRIVEAHHGTIELESELGMGSRFSVRLPLSQPTSQPPSARLAALDAAPQP
ncbi:MAG TPA: HAMP domain-containing sensor histidine kinase [Polyangiaceae bacterium]|nr:HAMP domain-containing sensor histidine kinase [Polyangiaceae bacterium]